MEGQLWETVNELANWDPDYVTMTYGAGGSTREPTLAAVKRMVGDMGLSTAAHLTCVDASRDEVRAVVEEFRAAGVRRIVCLAWRSDDGCRHQLRPASPRLSAHCRLVRDLVAYGDLDVSVSAYPEMHPESPSIDVDIDTLKSKADAGAHRALTQFFFDNDIFERYLEKVRAAGITIPVVPGIMPIQNLTQLKRFARRCGASVPAFLDARFEGLDEKPEERAEVAADIAAEQIADLQRRGIHEFHLYTMNRVPLIAGTLERLGLRRRSLEAAEAAA